ncbi:MULTISPECIES: AbiH family protein [unclassified Lactococcus]|uniref:AbiH family protein n=1 Tax=unclassified Lactococcus TaxID=2643510 RepID=UPI001E530319|nr:MULTISPECIES: AbiH family protein [unclassified Lactococcus]
MKMITGSKQLVILGNGFDLACGLKSSYTNFFDYSENNDKWEGNYWRKLFQNLRNLGLWSDVERQIIIELRNISILSLVADSTNDIVSIIGKQKYQYLNIAGNQDIIKNNYSVIYGDYDNYLESLNITQNTISKFFNTVTEEKNDIKSRN